MSLVHLWRDGSSNVQNCRPSCLGYSALCTSHRRPSSVLYPLNVSVVVTCIACGPVLLLTEPICSCICSDHTCSIGINSWESADGVCRVMQAAEVRMTEVCGFDVSAVNRHRWHPGHTAGLSVCLPACLSVCHCWHCWYADCQTALGCRAWAACTWFFIWSS